MYYYKTNEQNYGKLADKSEQIYPLCSKQNIKRKQLKLRYTNSLFTIKSALYITLISLSSNKIH